MTSLKVNGVIESQVLSHEIISMPKDALEYSVLGMPMNNYFCNVPLITCRTSPESFETSQCILG